jgi:hypothetical protein
VGKHLFEIAGDGDFLYRVSKGTIFNPVSGCAFGIIAGYKVDTMPHEFADNQAPMHLSHQIVKIFLVGFQYKIMCTTGIASRCHAKLASRIGRKEITLQ